MKLNLIFFKNVKIKAFTTPNFTDIEPEVAAKQLERSIVLNADNQELIKPYENLDMFFVGTFDDETGEIIQNDEPEFLFSPRELIIDLKEKKLAEAIVKAAEKKEVSKDESDHA